MRGYATAMKNDLRVCQCAECRSWVPPHLSEDSEEKVWWRGHWYEINRFWSNYFARKNVGPNRLTLLLHREIYEAHVGSIPEGFIVHHRDHNKYNNQPDNLVAISKSDHSKETGHGGDKLRAYVKSHTKEEWSQRTKALRWTNPKPRDYVCVQCGQAFQSIGMRAKFCAVCRPRRKNSL